MLYLRRTTSKIVGLQAGKGKTVDFASELTGISPPTYSLSLSPISHSWLLKSSISLSASHLSLFCSSLSLILFPLLSLKVCLLHHFLLFLYFVPPSFSFVSLCFPLYPPSQPLLIPVCYPSSPCRQRSLTTDSLLPFLLPNPYTTSRYWLHAELPGPRPPPFPLAFPAASPL